MCSLTLVVGITLGVVMIGTGFGVVITRGGAVTGGNGFTGLGYVYPSNFVLDSITMALGVVTMTRDVVGTGKNVGFGVTITGFCVIITGRAVVFGTSNGMSGLS